MVTVGTDEFTIAGMIAMIGMVVTMGGIIAKWG
jgi:hypothetical protein